MAAGGLFGAESVLSLREALAQDPAKPVRDCLVEGAVAMVPPGQTAGFYLEDESGGIYVRSASRVTPGQRVRVAGRCSLSAGTSLEAEASQLEILSGFEPLKPRRLLADEARKPDWQNTLAEVDGVVADVFQRDGVEYVWLRGELPFRAFFQPQGSGPVLGTLEPGMRIILRGVLVPQPDSNETPRPHELSLRSVESHARDASGAVVIGVRSTK